MKTNKAKQHYYAIGISSWVELRKSPTRPMPNVTEHVNIVKRQKMNYYTMKLESAEEKFRIVNTVFKGGKVVGHIPFKKFYMLTKRPIHNGQMEQLTPTMVAILRGGGYLDAGTSKDIREKE